jgi:cytochrome c
VFCFQLNDGTIVANSNPVMMGKDSRTLKVGDDPLGQRIFDTIKNAPEGTVSTLDYKFPKPGTAEPVPKKSCLTRI